MAKSRKRGKAQIVGCSCSVGSVKNSNLGPPSFVRCRSKRNGRFTKFKGCRKVA